MAVVPIIEYPICPPDCSLCEQACADIKDGRSRLEVVHLPELAFYSVVNCHQCVEPFCLRVCPTGAITKSDGVVRITAEKCVGCGLCTLACPYGAIHYDPATETYRKCDTCDGEPKCLEACKFNVLSVPLRIRKMIFHPEKCTGCYLCAMACSLYNEGVVNPLKARTKIIRVGDVPEMLVLTEDCKLCGHCVTVCPYEARELVLVAGEPAQAVA